MFTKLPASTAVTLAATGSSLRLAGGALTTSGTFINNGLFDRMTGSQIIPFNLVSNGTVLNASVVKVKSIKMVNDTASIRNAAYLGNTYQLQSSNSLTPNTWVSSGAAPNGMGDELVFTVNSTASTPHRFYRIAVTP